MGPFPWAERKAMIADWAITLLDGAMSGAARSHNDRESDHLLSSGRHNGGHAKHNDEPNTLG